jgi:Protein of unknown function (DUF4231)
MILARNGGDGMWGFSNAQRMNKNAAIAELRQRIDAMQEAIQPLLAGDKVRTARWEDWKYNLVHATWRQNGNKRSFYDLRLVAIISGIAVPSLVGLNLAGTGGVVVRWLTFGLSLVAAIATAIITLYRMGDRWLMYRRLADSLMVIGYTLVDNYGTDPQQEQTAWKTFTSATDRAIADYNRTYEAAVIQVAQSGSSQPGPGIRPANTDNAASVPNP